MMHSESGLLDRILSVAVEAAREAGGMLLDKWQTDFEVTKKGRINLVTEMDLAAERIIVERIHRDFPDHAILAEEQGKESGEGPFTWIIDPLDGTTNYAHGYRFFCVSVGVERDGQMVAGVVYDPVVSELFEARRGQGARLNGQPIQVSNEDQLVDCLICTGFSYDEEKIKENLEHFNRVIMQARAVRRDGSAALDLCYVACGRFEGFWELSLHPWDVAAGKLIVEEAGGQVTHFDGSPCTIYDAEILATNGKIHQRLGSLLSSKT